MEMENNTKPVRTHRVGSVTAGASMIIFGVLFLLHLIFDFINYTTIFSFWPVLLIGLGIEVLISNLWEKKIVYDKAAIFLLITMAFFVMLMALADVCIKIGTIYMNHMV